jgi:hypothetical protein
MTWGGLRFSSPKLLLNPMGIFSQLDEGAAPYKTGTIEIATKIGGGRKREKDNCITCDNH